MSRLAIVALALGIPACAASGVEDQNPGDGTDERACPAIRGIANNCGDLLNEPIYVTMIDRGVGQPHDIALVGEMSGDSCTIGHFPALNSIEYVSSLAVIGTDIFYCAATNTSVIGQLTRVSMLDGKVSLAPVNCTALASMHDELYVMTDVAANVKHYVNWEAALANTATIEPIANPGPRLGAAEQTLYTSLETSDAVYAYDPKSQASTTLAMTGTTINVSGLAGQKGSLAILDATGYDQFVYTFDATTGAQKTKVPVGTNILRVHGLSNACQVPAIE